MRKANRVRRVHGAAVSLLTLLAAVLVGPPAHGDRVIATAGCSAPAWWNMLIVVYRESAFGPEKLDEIAENAQTAADWLGETTGCAAALRFTILDQAGTLPSPALSEAENYAGLGYDVLYVAHPATDETWQGKTNLRNVDLPMDAQQPTVLVLLHEWLHILERWCPTAPWPDADPLEDAIHEWSLWGYSTSYADLKSFQLDLLGGRVDGSRGMRASDWTCAAMPHTYVADTAVYAPDVAQTFGQPADVLVRVEQPEKGPNGYVLLERASGPVSVTIGSLVLAGTVGRGLATVTIPAQALPPGSHKARLSYAGVANLFRPSTSSFRVVVAEAPPSPKAKPTVAVTAAKKRIRAGQVARFTVTVTAPGLRPTGRVSVQIAGASRSATLKDGRATVAIKIDKRARKGRTTAVAIYRGSSALAPATAKLKNVVIVR